MDELQADVICFSNLKGSKEKDLLGTAEALQFKKGLPGFGSNSSVGTYYGVSGEMVRQFLTLLTLPKHIQSLIAEGKLGLDISSRLARVSRQRPAVVDELAYAVSDLPAMDARDVIEYVIKNPDVAAGEAKRRVMDSKTVIEDEYYVVVVFSKEEYDRIEYEARRRQMSPGRLIAELTNQRLGEATDHATR